MSWPLPDDLDDARLEAALYPPTAPWRVRRPEPDLGARAPGAGAAQVRDASAPVVCVPRGTSGRVSVQPLLRPVFGSGAVGSIVVLRQVYRAGEKAFVDYAGPTVEVTDRRTGETHEAKVFVGVLACALGHQDLPQRHLHPLPSASSRLLVLDDWGLASLSGQSCHDPLEVLDDYYARRGTILASQLPVEHWHVVVDPGRRPPRVFGARLLW